MVKQDQSPILSFPSVPLSRYANRCNKAICDPCFEADSVLVANYTQLFSKKGNFFTLPPVACVNLWCTMYPSTTENGYEHGTTKRRSSDGAGRALL